MWSPEKPRVSELTFEPRAMRAGLLGAGTSHAMKQKEYRLGPRAAGIKAYELRTKSKEQLESQLLDLKKELAALKVQKLSRPSLPKIHTVRKDIARVLTIINENQRNAVKELYKGAKYQPKDMRAKKTRALRRALTKFEASRTTEKQRKKQIAFPQRKFAIKA